MLYVITYRGRDGKFETVEFPERELVESLRILQSNGNKILIVTGIDHDGNPVVD